jgi:hypothetical protein
MGVPFDHLALGRGRWHEAVRRRVTLGNWAFLQAQPIPLRFTQGLFVFPIRRDKARIWGKFWHDPISGLIWPIIQSKRVRREGEDLQSHLPLEFTRIYLLRSFTLKVPFCYC